MSNVQRALRAGLLVALLGCGGAQAGGLPAFGVVADVQYGDKEARGPRDYRGRLRRLERCAETFNQQQLEFVIQLGDLIDGATNAAQTARDLDAALATFNRINAPKRHVVGNHCLNAGTNALARKLGLDRFHYTFTAPGAPGWRFVVLDGNDAGYGVMGDAQLDWFGRTLGQAQQAGERVICFCHYPLLKAAAKHHRMAKPDAILKVLDAHTCVAAWIAGHDHAGGYARQRHVHHLTMCGLVEAAGSTAFARFELADDRMIETGFGNEPKRELLFLRSP